MSSGSNSVLSRGGLALLTCLVMVSHALAAAGEPAIDYPVVFTSNSELEGLGLSLDWPPPKLIDALKLPRFPNGCYLYRGRDRDHLISMSDEFLARHIARGFSRESLCMALVSEARFDPETGQRLVTYVLRNDETLDRHLDSLSSDRISPQQLGDLVPGVFSSKVELAQAVAVVRKREFSALTDDQIAMLVPDGLHSFELPLEVPDCFKNGTPLLDCRWTYGLKSGRKLSAKAPTKYREAGELIAQQIQQHIASGAGQRPYATGDPYARDTPANRSYTTIDRLVRTAAHGTPDTWPYVLTLNVPDDTAEWCEPVAWYATSPALPRGYGYALFAWSAYSDNVWSVSEDSRGPAVSVASLRTAFDPTKRATHSKLIRVKAALR
jgi:hypothetical protein